jgi:uncharacterized membrane protein YsdA (DUF1294 family)
MLLVIRLGVGPLIAYLVAVNTTTLLAYTYDKGIAGGDRQRVPERVLHGLAFAGGTPAALVGQVVLRHKIRKTAFRVWFWVIACGQVILLGALAWLRAR